MYGIDTGDYWVGPFSSEDSMGRWLTKHFSDELKSEDIQPWNEAKEEMSFDDWAEELILSEIINAAFEFESPD